jgi:hypothetical protein
MDFDDFDDFLFGFNSLSIQEPESFKLEYVRNDIETSIDDDVELWRLFRSVRKDIVINRLAHQITMARSGFLLPLDTMAARLNFLLAELPRLQIPGGEPLKQFTVFPSLPPESKSPRLIFLLIYCFLLWNLGA